MNCCDEYGDCRQGRDCPIRTNMKTLREEVESEVFGISPGKIGKRTPAFWIHQAPSAWRKTMKYWAVLALGIVLGAVGGGVLAVVVGVVR